MVSFKAVRVSVLCRDPWIKQLSTYHVKKFRWFLSYQQRLWKIQNVEKKCFTNSSNNLDWPVSLDVVGIWEICARKNQVNVCFALRCVSYMNVNSLFLTWCIFCKTDCMGKVSALLLVRIPLLMVDVRLKIRAFGTSLCLIGSKYRVVFEWGLMGSVHLWEIVVLHLFMLISCYSLRVSLYMIT